MITNWGVGDRLRRDKAESPVIGKVLKNWIAVKIVWTHTQLTISIIIKIKALKISKNKYGGLMKNRDKVSKNNAKDKSLGSNDKLLFAHILFMK